MTRVEEVAYPSEVTPSEALKERLRAIKRTRAYERFTRHQVTSEGAWVERAGVKRQSLFYYLSGRNETIPYETVYALAEAGGVDLRWLFLGPGLVPIPSDPSLLLEEIRSGSLQSTTPEVQDSRLRWRRPTVTDPTWQRGSIPAPRESGVRLVSHQIAPEHALIAAVLRWPNRWRRSTALLASETRGVFDEHVTVDEIVRFLDVLDAR